MSTCQLPAETSVSMLHDWVDPLLHKTILWLTDEKDNAAAAVTDAENSDFRCLSIARDIITRRRFHLRVFFLEIHQSHLVYSQKTGSCCLVQNQISCKT